MTPAERAKRWAKRQMLFELRVDVARYGYACNVQQSHPKASETDLAKRREARRLLRIAIKAVENAS